MVEKMQKEDCPRITRTVFQYTRLFDAYRAYSDRISK